MGGLLIEHLLAWLGQAVAELISFIIQMTTASTATRISGSGTVEWLGRMMGIGIPLVIMFSSLNLVSASVKSGGFAGFGLWLKNTTVGAVALVLLEPLVILANNISEGIAFSIAQLIDKDMTKPDNIKNVFDFDASVIGANPWVVSLMFLGILATIIGSYIVLIVLNVRNVLLYFMMVVGAIAIAGIAWDKTAVWPRKWLSIMLGLLFAKLGVFIVLAVGVGVWLDPPPIQGHDYTKMIGNQTLMVVTFVAAAVSPFLAFKLFDFMGDGLANSLHQPTGAGRFLVNKAAYANRQSGGLMSKINANKVASGGAKAGGAGGAAAGAASKAHPAAAAALAAGKAGKSIGSSAVNEPLSRGGNSSSGGGGASSVSSGSGARSSGRSGKHAVTPSPASGVSGGVSSGGSGTSSTPAPAPSVTPAPAPVSAKTSPAPNLVSVKK